MLNSIQEKLNNEFQKPFVSESQVVYILSRIRKVLEIDKDSNNGKYKKLKFYCDWALHAEINKGTRAFKEEFGRFVERDLESGSGILNFQFFDAELFFSWNSTAFHMNSIKPLKIIWLLKNYLLKYMQILH